MFNDVIYIQREPGIWINLDDSGAKKLQKFRTGTKCTKFLRLMSIIGYLRYLYKRVSKNSQVHGHGKGIV